MLGIQKLIAPVMKQFGANFLAFQVSTHCPSVSQFDSHLYSTVTSTRFCTDKRSKSAFTFAPAFELSPWRRALRRRQCYWKTENASRGTSSSPLEGVRNFFKPKL
jgi:hypothetical protein